MYDIVLVNQITQKMLLLEIISSLLLLFNKYFVFLKKPFGWLLGIFGLLGTVFYFYLRMKHEGKDDLWIMEVHNSTLVIIMIYGYLIATAHRNPRTFHFLKKWNVRFKAMLSVIAVGICTYLLIEAVSSGFLYMQFLTMVLGLAATLLVAFDTNKSNLIGWLVYLGAHIASTQVMFQADTPYLAVGQMLSGVVAILGFLNELKKSKTEGEFLPNNH